MERKIEQQNRTTFIDRTLDELSPLGTLVAAAISVYTFSKLGIKRALFLGVKSLIRGPQIKSLRTSDVEAIRRNVHGLCLTRSNDHFLVVRGPKGIGKTVAIQNALAHTWGVCFVNDRIMPGKDQDTILDRVLGVFTEIPFCCVDKIKAAKRVIFWNSFFTFLSGRHRKPIVVISTQTRYKNEPYVRIAQAASLLAGMGIRVIVDCEENALDDDKSTLRELSIEMEPMSLDLIEKMPQIQELIGFLKKNNLFEVTAEVLGGVPMYWVALSSEINMSNNNDKYYIWSKLEIVKSYLVRVMEYAIDDRDVVIEHNEKLKNLLNEFVGQPATFELGLSTIRHYLSARIIDTKPVLRRSLNYKYKPKTAAMSILLRAGVEKNPKLSFESIIESVAKIKKT